MDVRDIWETPFDLSMLDGDVLILCPDGDLAPKLMVILGEHGVKWDMSDRFAFEGNSLWDRYKERTCYRVCGKSMGYCSKDYYESNMDYRNYIKSTFYGVESEPGVEISEEEFEAILLCIKGRK